MAEESVIESTWSWRELPVLRALYAREEAAASVLPASTTADPSVDTPDDWERRGVQEIENLLAAVQGPPTPADEYASLAQVLAGATGLAADEVYRTLRRLHEAGYLVGERLLGPGLRAVGAWPNENTYEAILKVLERQIEAEQDPETKSKLRQLVTLLHGLGREVGTSLLTKLLERMTGLA